MPAPRQPYRIRGRHTDRAQPQYHRPAPSVSLPIRHAGPTVITASVRRCPATISQINNQAAFTLTGIHKRLNVLLISGSPDQGERAWRLLLKSDPAVQLVHFTILRTPGEPLDADPQDIALVPFPVRELFETDIGEIRPHHPRSVQRHGTAAPQLSRQHRHLCAERRRAVDRSRAGIFRPRQPAFSP